MRLDVRRVLVMGVATLDIDRFDKVRHLIREGATKGERVAAHARADAMAKAAGLTFTQACAKAEARKAPPAASTQAETFAAAMNAVFNTPEARAERAERDTKRLARCEELLSRYGSEDAVYADTPREAALRKACEPIQAEIEEWGLLGTAKDMPASVRAAVASAWPMPATVSQAWAEFSAADKLADDRVVFAPNWDDWEHVRARTYLLEEACDTLPAVTVDDVLARISWMQHLNEQGWHRDVHEDIVLLAALRSDVERLAVQFGRSSAEGEARPTVQSGHATAAERRKAALSILEGPDGVLSDREIARRVGVSPTTVGKLRRVGVSA